MISAYERSSVPSLVKSAKSILQTLRQQTRHRKCGMSRKIRTVGSYATTEAVQSTELHLAGKGEKK